jgi:hypothetical protein
MYTIFNVSTGRTLESFLDWGLARQEFALLQQNHPGEYGLLDECGGRIG